MSSRGRSRRKPVQKFKVVLLGEGRVGKTSILIRFCQNTFNDRQQPTLQASYLDRKVTVDGQSVQLSVWDTAGQVRALWRTPRARARVSRDFVVAVEVVVVVGGGANSNRYEHPRRAVE